MVCEDYYTRHSPFEGIGDRCNRNDIAAGTATQFSILGMTTTFCGTINLFVAGWTVKKFGPRLALMVQTLVPAIRVATQILAVMAGGATGITIFQCTQLITVVGGPAGYMYARNVALPFAIRMMLIPSAVLLSIPWPESSFLPPDEQSCLACCKGAL